MPSFGIQPVFVLHPVSPLTNCFPSSPAWWCVVICFTVIHLDKSLATYTGTLFALTKLYCVLFCTLARLSNATIPIADSSIGASNERVDTHHCTSRQTNGLHQLLKDVGSCGHRRKFVEQGEIITLRTWNPPSKTTACSSRLDKTAEAKPCTASAKFYRLAQSVPMRARFAITAHASTGTFPLCVVQEGSTVGFECTGYTHGHRVLLAFAACPPPLMTSVVVASSSKGRRPCCSGALHRACRRVFSLSIPYSTVMRPRSRHQDFAPVEQMSKGFIRTMSEVCVKVVTLAGTSILMLSTSS